MVIIIYCMNQMYLTGYFIKLHTKVLNLYNYFYLFVTYYILLYYIVDWQTYCIFLSYNKQHYTDVCNNTPTSFKVYTVWCIGVPCILLFISS